MTKFRVGYDICKVRKANMHVKFKRFLDNFFTIKMLVNWDGIRNVHLIGN